MELASIGVLTFGDLDFRGKCPKESVEQVTFFNRLRAQYPKSWGLIAVHPRNEGLVIGGQFASVRRAKAEGMTKGAADIVIPGAPSFICELKRRDYTKSDWQEGQREYLAACAETGSFACVALGVDAAWRALGVWIANQEAK